VASENRVRAGGKVQQKLSRDGGGGASELVGTRGAQQAFQHEVRGLLVGVSPSDPLTLLAAALGLLLVTMATCCVPARRVSKIPRIDEAAFTLRSRMECCY